MVQTPEKKARFAGLFCCLQVAVDLARRCKETLIARTVPLALDAFSGIMRREGFELAREWRGTKSKNGDRILAIYNRVHPPVSDSATQYR